VTKSLHPSRYALPGVVVPAQLDYAIRGLVSLALATDHRTKIEVLASDHGLSRKFLAQVLVELRNAGIVTTHRGSDGGYGLARPADEIRVVDIFDAVSPGHDYDPRPANGSRAATVTMHAWSTLSGATREALARMTLADLSGIVVSTLSDEAPGSSNPRNRRGPRRSAPAVRSVGSGLHPRTPRSDCRGSSRAPRRRGPTG
jgi:Rrf2 family protein